MTGRIFAVLIIGVVAAALVSSVLASLQRRADVNAERLDRVVDRVSTQLATDSPIPGVHRLQSWPEGTSADRLSERLAARLSAWRAVGAENIPASNCAPPPPVTPKIGPSPPAPPPPPPTPECYAVHLVDARGQDLLLAIDASPTPKLVDDSFNWAFVAALCASALVLGLVIARMAARPIARLGAAAQRLAADLNAAPIAAEGPTEVRRTIAAFNNMQVELRRAMEERTYMLAAISHDLRSPLTRMRLRFDGIDDATLRAKLVEDARIMGGLIEEGLEFARLAHSGEPFERVDARELIASLCEDAQEIGQPVRSAPLPSLIIRTRPEALRRIITNLVENAVTYGRSADLSATVAGNVVTIDVADSGPGIPPEALATVFEPFRRLDDARPSGGGTGLGLTIAQLLAHKIGGSISLANRPEGGLCASLSLPFATN